MFKVDTATVGSLLDDTNARNWRDALLQVFIRITRITMFSIIITIIVKQGLSLTSTFDKTNQYCHCCCFLVSFKSAPLQPSLEQDGAGDEVADSSSSPPKAKDNQKSAEVGSMITRLESSGMRLFES